MLTILQDRPLLVDSHCHLNMLDLSLFDNNMDKVLQTAQEHEVTHFLCVAVTLDDYDQIIEYTERYHNVFASVGLHPNEQPDRVISAEDILANADHPKVIAVGETGLDYYRVSGDVNWQQQRFRTQIQAAKQLQLPLIIHTRQAREDTIAIMREEQAQEVGGVMHCFTESWDMAKQALDLGFYISLSGIVTFKNAKDLHDLAKQVPLDRLLVETDCPYLAPVPFRGKPNQPAYVRYVAQAIAELRGITFETVAEQTTNNFFTLFPRAKK